MKKFLTAENIAKGEVLPGSDRQMLYKDDSGRSFIGPFITAPKGKIVVVEVNDGTPINGCFHIIRVISEN